MRAHQSSTWCPASSVLKALSLVCLVGVAPVRAQASDATGCTKVPSVIKVAAAPAWEVRASRINAAGTLSRVHFIDERNGWAAGERALYRTADGGESWRQAAVKVPAGFRVARILFVNPSFGWVVLEKFSYGFKDRRLWLVSTGDGGQSWRPRLKLQGAFDGGLSFAADGAGWLAVNRFRPPASFGPQVFRTTDGGASWADASGDLLKAAPANEAGFSVMLSGVAAASSSRATLGATGGETFTTDDGGRGWRGTAFPCRSSGHVRSLRMGMKGSGRLWMEEGADSLEGYRADVFEQQGGGDWVKYSLPNFAIADAFYVTENEAFAAGSLIDPGTQRREAAVLHSVDGGRSWTLVHRDARAKRFHSLAALSHRAVWAAGEAGLVIRLTAPE